MSGEDRAPPAPNARGTGHRRRRTCAGPAHGRTKPAALPVLEIALRFQEGLPQQLEAPIVRVFPHLAVGGLEQPL